MRFSVRTLMALVLAAALAIVAWKSYLEAPPSGRGSWSNRATMYADDHSTAIARFDFGGFEANGEPFAGYLIQIENPKTTSDVPWLEFKQGCLHVEGNRVLPGQKFQLFVSENGNAPARILLEPDDATKFEQLPASYEQWETFWSNLNTN